jgi:CSLREA domain-containing protein
LNSHLSRVFKRVNEKYIQRKRLRKRDRFRKYFFEVLEPRNLLATYTVTSLSDIVNPADDATVFTLREAIIAANASANVDDTIVFAPAITANAPALITLTGGELPINAGAGSVSIVGPGANRLSVSGNNASRIFLVNGGATADIKGLTIRNGNAASGGGIQNLGTLVIEDSSFESNTTSGDGGAIRSTGSLQVIGSTFSGNSAIASAGAIGVYFGGHATIVRSTMSGNSAQRYGGAIDVNGSTATIIYSTIVMNKAQS